MNKAILIVSVLALLTIMTILQQQNVHATPITTNFGNGYADGKQATQSTFHSGNGRDASCPTSFFGLRIVLHGISYELHTTWAELWSGNST